MTDQEMEEIYLTYLEEDIVKCISRRRNVPLEEGLRLYYTSRLANRIREGLYGIQYLDYKLLTEYLEEELRNDSK